jgi:uncharacterized protein with ATP-grasp and redox domains
MRAWPDCFPCSLNQVLRLLKMDGVDPDETLCALRDAFERIKGFDLSHSPAYVANHCIREAAKHFRSEDPYKRAKREQNELALRALDELRESVLSSDDPLKTALLMSASGNIIDLGTADTFDFHSTYKRNLQRGFALDDSPLFLKRLATAKTVLLIADNCGEIVFDVFVLNLLPGRLEKIIAAKSGPVLNDATVDDVGDLDTEGIRVVNTGSDGLGVMFQEISDEFRGLFDTSDVVISKGHANFETLDSADREVFLLLQVKCPVVADRLGVRVGDTAFVSNRRLTVET